MSIDKLLTCLYYSHLRALRMVHSSGIGYSNRLVGLSFVNIANDPRQKQCPIEHPLCL